MKSAIVTGGNGFIGRRMVKKLQSNQVEVTAIDIYHDEDVIANRGKEKLLKVDYSNLQEAYDKIPESVDVLYHFAWNGVSANQRNNFDVQLVNINMSFNVMKMAHLKKVKKVILLGSASEFANSNMTIKGKNIASPIEAYGAVKYASNLINTMYASLNGIECIGTIITSVYGPGRDDNNILSYAIKTMLNGEAPSFTPLEQRWDFLYISDLLEALFLIGLRGKSEKTYAVGSGVSKPMKEYIEIIRDAIDPSIILNIGKHPYKAGKPDNSIFNIEELSNDTGFAPNYRFERGIKKVISYFKSVNI